MTFDFGVGIDGLVVDITCTTALSTWSCSPAHRFCGRCCEDVEVIFFRYISYSGLIHVYLMYEALLDLVMCRGRPGLEISKSGYQYHHPEIQQGNVPPAL